MIDETKRHLAALKFRRRLGTPTTADHVGLSERTWFR